VTLDALARTVEGVVPGSGRALRDGPTGAVLRLAIAGVPIELHGLDETAGTILERRFSGWGGAETGPPGATLRLSWLPARYRDPELGREEEYRLDGGRVLRGRASVAGDPASHVVEAAVAADPALLGQEIENILRLVVAERLLRAGALLLHAGAVAVPGGAVAFPAASGTGKTTLVRELSAAGLEPLGDDMVAVAPGDGSWMLRPVPFTGERSLRGAPGPRPLLAIHPLRRGAGPRLHRLSGARAAAALANQTLGLALFPEHGAAGLETAALLAAAVPVETLERSLGDDAAALIRTRHGAPR